MKYAVGNAVGVPFRPGSGTKNLSFYAPLTSSIKLATGQDDISQFDGIDDVVCIDKNTKIDNIFDGGGSVSCWINPKSDGGGNLGRVSDKTQYQIKVQSESGNFVSLNILNTFDGGSNGAWRTSSAIIPLNEWTHIVIIYDNSLTTNDPIFYINGVVKTVGSGLTELTTPVGTRSSDANSDLYFGDTNGGSRGFDGQLENYQSYSKIINQTEVTTLVNAGRYGNPLDDTTLINYYKFKANKAGVSQFFDSSGNGSSGTAFSNTGEFARTTTGTVKDYNDNIVNCAIDEPRFQGARRIQEYRWSDKEAENAIEFDGVDDDVLVPDNAAIQNVADNGATWSFWINPKSTGGGNFGRVYSKGVFDIYVQDESGGNTSLKFFHQFTGTDGTWALTSRNIPLNQWTHVVICYDNSSVTNNPIMYINSVAKTVGSGLTETTPTGTRDSDIGDDLHIGSSVSIGSRFFDGSIDNLKIWTTELTAEEAINEYNSTRKDTNTTQTDKLAGWWKLDDTDSSITDYSGNGNTGTFRDNTTPATPVNVDGAYDDGTVLTTLKGVLIEEQKENEVTYSEALDNATGGWAESNVTPTLNFALSPDGVNSTATKLTPSIGTNSFVNIKRNLTITDNVDITLSFFAKKNDYDWVRVISVNKANTGYVSYFNIDAPVAGTVGHSDYRIEEYASGWVRVSVVFPSSAGVTTPFIHFGLCDANDDTDATGDGSKYNLFWGAQVEEGSFASSYVKTVASTVTRTKDLLFYPALNNVNEAEGAVICDFNMLGINAGSFPGMVTISDTTATNRIMLWSTDDKKIRLRIVDDSSTQVDLQSSSIAIVYDTDQSAGHSFKVNDVDGFIDGASFGTDTSATLPTGLTIINIGTNQNEIEQINGAMKNVKIWKKKLSDSIMERETN